jgi:hypothetical protein
MTGEVIGRGILGRHGNVPSQRGGGEYRWKRSRPYHVALEDGYIRAHWGFMNRVCRMNSIPFDGTGEHIQRDGTWCVYEFAIQLDAIQF